MMEADELRALCPGCPTITALASQRESRGRELQMLDEDTHADETERFEERAAWDDEDARKLARSCLGVVHGNKLMMQSYGRSDFSNAAICGG